MCNILMRNLPLCCAAIFATFCFCHSAIGSFNILAFITNWSVSGTAGLPLPKDFLVTEELVKKEGYGFEMFNLTSEDGYRIKLSRILHPKRDSSSRGQPVLLAHGILASSDQWVLRGKSSDLAFLLVEQGYDVWIDDVRGNCYCKYHKTLSPENIRFWDFTFHEIAVHDLPVFVDFILDKTGAARLGYVGHSMGTTELFILTSLRPQYNEKIGAAVLLAPIAAKLSHDSIKNPLLRYGIEQADVLYGVAKSAGIYEVFPRTSRTMANVIKYCSTVPELDYCFDVFGLLVGENRENIDKTNITSQLSHFPAGTSIRTVHHLTQMFKYGFRMYDYGPQENKLKYNSTLPPEYPIEKISTPLLLQYGENDPWTSKQGIEWLSKTIPGVKKTSVVPDHKFTHADFIIGMNTNETIYFDIFEFFDEYLK